MNTRTAVATVALACLNLAAIALQTESGPALFPAGQLLVTSAGSGAIAAYDAGGGTLPQPLTGLHSPQDLAFAPDGALFVSDAASGQVLLTDADGKVLDTLGPDSPLVAFIGLAFGPDGALYVASSGTDSIDVFDRSGQFTDELGTNADLDQPWGLAFGPDGRLYVASTGSNSVAVLDPSGALLETFNAKGDLLAPLGLCFDGDGTLWVSSSGNNTVLAFDGDGNVLHTFDGQGQLDTPAGLIFGQDGLLYVNSSGNDRVLAMNSAGHVLRVYGLDGSAPAPRGIAFAPYLFKATLKGRLAHSGSKDLKFSSKAIVSYVPGRPQWSVRLTDPSDALAAAWDSDTWILRGRMADLANGKGSILGTMQLGTTASQRGLSAAQLTLKGKFQAVPGAPNLEQVFVPKSLAGDFHRSGPTGLAVGTVKTGAQLKP
jgi:DNA-binding beta-propeller fold protein YncE